MTADEALTLIRDLTILFGSATVILIILYVIAIFQKEDK